MTTNRIKQLQDKTVALLQKIKADTVSIKDTEELREVLRFHEYRYYIQSDPLISQFRLTYNMVLNLLRVPVTNFFTQILTLMFIDHRKSSRNSCLRSLSTNSRIGPLSQDFFKVSFK